VQLKVSDSKAATSTDTVTVSTLNSKPTANAGMDTSVVVGDLVRLDGTKSSDPDGDQLSYAWSFSTKPAASTAVLSNATLAQPAFTADKEGQYVLQVIVNDGVNNSDPDTVKVTAGAVSDPCANKPAAPAGVTASDGGYTDHVEITWAAVSGASAYQVYRGDAHDSATATAISGWVTSPLYNDTTAEAPITQTVQGFACNQSSTSTPHYYYYWVKTRNTAQCESDFSAADQGYCGSNAAKAARPGTRVAVSALPSKVLDAQTRLALPNDTLYLRVRSVDADIVSVWGRVKSADFDSDAVRWIPADPASARDGWVAFSPTAPWTPGAIITMTAGATTADGTGVGPVAYSFLVGPDISSVPAQQSSSTASPEKGLCPVLIAAGTGSATFDDGYGAPYLLRPDAPYAQPQRIWLPIPAGIDPGKTEVYFFYDDGTNPAWHASPDVVGWELPGQRLVEERDGATYLGLLVTHGGLIQLGPSTLATHAAAIWPSMGQLGDLLTAALVLLIFAASSRYLRWRQSQA
jgi:hypothetical protein